MTSYCLRLIRFFVSVAALGCLMLPTGGYAQSTNAAQAEALQVTLLPVVRAFLESCPDVIKLAPEAETEYRKRVASKEFNKSHYLETLANIKKEKDAACTKLKANPAGFETPLSSVYVIWR